MFIKFSSLEVENSSLVRFRNDFGRGLGNRASPTLIYFIPAKLQFLKTRIIRYMCLVAAKRQWTNVIQILSLPTNVVILSRIRMVQFIQNQSSFQHHFYPPSHAWIVVFHSYRNRACSSEVWEDCRIAPFDGVDSSNASITLFITILTIVRCLLIHLLLVPMTHRSKLHRLNERRRHHGIIHD